MLQDKLKLLTSIPRVGIVLVTKAVTDLLELGEIELSKLTVLTNLTPYAHNSGNMQGKRFIFAGKAGLRKILYMAAVASLRCNCKLKKFCDRLITDKIALVALMRKLLSFIHAVIKNNSY